MRIEEELCLQSACTLPHPPCPLPSQLDKHITVQGGRAPARGWYCLQGWRGELPLPALPGRGWLHSWTGAGVHSQNPLAAAGHRLASGSKALQPLCSWTWGASSPKRSQRS